METMKRIWVSPVSGVQRFVPQEFVAACALKTTSCDPSAFECVYGWTVKDVTPTTGLIHACAYSHNPHTGETDYTNLECDSWFLPAPDATSAQDPTKLPEKDPEHYTYIDNYPTGLSNGDIMRYIDENGQSHDFTLTSGMPSVALYNIFNVSQ